MNKFDSILYSIINSHEGLLCTLTGYQYSEIMRASLHSNRIQVHSAIIMQTCGIGTLIPHETIQTITYLLE